jgi:hypothetical protein
VTLDVSHNQLELIPQGSTWLSKQYPEKYEENFDISREGPMLVWDLKYQFCSPNSSILSFETKLFFLNLVYFIAWLFSKTTRTVL